MTTREAMRKEDGAGEEFKATAHKSKSRKCMRTWGSKNRAGPHKVSPVSLYIDRSIITFHDQEDLREPARRRSLRQPLVFSFRH